MDGRQKRHEFTNMGKVKRLSYDGKCTTHHFRFGVYKISNRFIFVGQSEPSFYGYANDISNVTNRIGNVVAVLTFEVDMILSGGRQLDWVAHR